MGSLSQIKGGTLIGYLAIAINVVAGLLYTPWMVSVLGKSDYGLYTLAVSLISLFMFDFGMSATVSRFLAREHAAGCEQRVSQLLGCFYKIYLVIDVVIFVVLAVVYFFINEIFSGLTLGEVERLKIVFVIAGAYNILVFPAIPLSGILTAYEKFIPLKLCDIFNKIFTILCVIISLSLGGGLYALVCATALSGLLTTAIKYIIVRKSARIKADLKFWSKSVLGELLGFSVWTTVINLAQRLIFNITPSILGIVANSGAVAVFGITSTIEGYVYTVANAMNGLFVARVANISVNDADRSRDAYLDLMIKVGRIQFIIVGLILAVFVSLGEEFIMLWLGSDYSDSYLAAIFILVPMIFSSSQQIAETVVSIENKVREQSGIFIAMAIVNIALTIPLSSVYGVIGAACSICVAYILRTVLMNVLYCKQLKINVFAFYKACYTSLWIPVLTTMLAGSILSLLLAGSGWTEFVLKSFALIVVYIVSLRPFLSSFEKSQLSGAIKSVVGKR